MGSRRTIPPTPFTPSASAAYTPPVPTRPEDFNLSSRRAFPLGRQPRPYAGLSRRTTQSALAYVESGQTDDLGASGPAGPPPDAQLEPPARDRLSLTQITSAAKSLADATSDTAVMDLMDEARSVAVALTAASMRRPLTEAEDEQWRELSELVGDTASSIAISANLQTPVQRARSRRVAASAGSTPGPSSSSSSSSTTTTAAPGYAPPTSQEMKDRINDFLATGGVFEQLKADTRITRDKLGKIMGALTIPTSSSAWDSKSNTWFCGKSFDLLRDAVAKVPDQTRAYQNMIRITTAFANVGFKIP